MKMNFIIIFAVVGLFAIPSIALFLICGANKSNKIWGTVTTVIFWMLLTVAIWGQNKTNTEVWNNGYCDCGTHWELTAVTRSYRGSETKYYVCPDCHTEIEINH
jgi:hypothetical protein